MKKQDFINKWIGWVSYSDREKLAIEMESDLQEIEKELSQDKWIKIESEKDFFKIQRIKPFLKPIKQLIQTKKN